MYMYVHVYCVYVFLCYQVQAVTIEGPGNFSSPITVTVGGRTASDNSSGVVVGVAIAIVVVIIILLVIVAGLLSGYSIK